jgi:hypothetical protein
MTHLVRGANQKVVVLMFQMVRTMIELSFALAQSRLCPAGLRPISIH